MIGIIVVVGNLWKWIFVILDDGNRVSFFSLVFIFYKYNIVDILRNKVGVVSWGF